MMKIGISSHVNFSDALDSCVASFTRAGFSKDDVYAFVGGHETYSKLDDTAYAVPHNSFDFTAMISVLDLGIEADAWMFVHDTVTIDDKFKDAVQKHVDKPICALTNDGASMNMGLFSWSKLVLIRDDLERFRNASKSTCVKFEDAFLVGAPAMNSAPRVTSGPEDVYSTGTPRVIEYYPDVGLYKYKSNWCIKDTYCIDL